MQLDNNANTLPENFDGVFRFTNFTSEPFTARWNSIEYTFDPESTTPLIVPGETPEGHQHIRKKFAKELAEKVFYSNDPKFQRLNDVKPGDIPALYTEEDLAPYIQRCLEPLPIATVKTKKVIVDNDKAFKKDEEGQNVTRVLKKNESLLDGATSING